MVKRKLPAWKNRNSSWRNANGNGEGSLRKERRSRLGLESLEPRWLLTAEIEPNDTLATATFLPANELVEGQVLNIGDVDHFRIALNHGDTFRLQTANTTDALFEPTLPPPVDLLDASGRQLASTWDGRDLWFTAPRADDFYIRMTSTNIFGTFTEDYSMQTQLTAFAGVSESEANDNRNSADVIDNQRMFRGEISAADVLDVYAIDLNPGDGLAIDFAGYSGESPGVRVVDDTGTLLVESTEGAGLAYLATAAGTHYIEIVDNTFGSGAGQYVGNVNVVDTATLSTGDGDFEAASNWDFASKDDFALGVLSEVGEIDIFRLDVPDFSRLNITLSPSGDDMLSDQSRELLLFSETGQLLAYSTNGTITQERTDASVVGTYFLGVQAKEEGGVGGYVLRKRAQSWYSNQRDRPLQFIDFDQQMASHLNFDWVNDYRLPETVPFVVGMFDSRFNAYGIDIVTQLPSDDQELVTHGYGDFGDIGAGGYGGGDRGQRSSNGRAVTSAQQTTWDSLSYASTGILNHEFGHAVGLPHARLPNSFMSYVTTNDVLPVGEGYSFRGTDSRRTGFSLRNERNYLDWSLQAGSQVADSDGSFQNPQALNQYFSEMDGELIRQPGVAAETRPNLVRHGDLNNDGNMDVVVSNANANSFQAYLNDGNGNFTQISRVAAEAIGWWTEPIAMADVNNDGRSDLVSISYDEQNMSVYLANADGSLGNPTRFALDSWPQSIAIEDLDGDSNLDVAIALRNDQVEVRFGNGNGGWSAADLYSVGDNPISITLGDFSGDGSLDIATANSDADSVSVLSNDGSGAFTLSDTLATGEDPRGITSEDFDGDGRADLAVTSRATDQTFVFLSESSGGFSAGVGYETQYDRHTISTGDVNRDGQPDLLVGGYDTNFRVLHGMADGTFSRPITVVGGDSEISGTAANFAGDDFDDLIVANYWGDDFSLYVSEENNASNDIVVVHGSIETRDEVDFFSLDVSAGETYVLDVDSAEFQYSLDASLRILKPDGSEVAESDGGLDLDSGLDSIDPVLVHTFAEAGTYLIVLSSEFQSVGRYRLKVTPERAVDQTGPRAIAAIPAPSSNTDSTKQIVILFDEQLDPETLTADSVQVVGENVGLQSGSLRFDPLDATLIWTGNETLALDTYTVTVRSGETGVTDTFGNPLDGESSNGLQFPEISGDGLAGGDLEFQFTISGNDVAPAEIESLRYLRDPYQRGRLQVRFNDDVSYNVAVEADIQLRGAGPDSVFNTADDRIHELDINQDRVQQFANVWPFLNLYTRGVPDPDLYRLEGTLEDAAGHLVVLDESINIGTPVPERALFQDSDATEPGLVGSYIDESLRGDTSQDDWRDSQTIAGTRVDYAIDFFDSSFGVRADVGITGGTDANWDDFSVQWDGWIEIEVDGTRLQTRSNDGSRLWIDVNGDGSFAADAPEFFENDWGLGRGFQAGALTEPLIAGRYQIRVQYEEEIGTNAMVLDWITPDLAGEEQGYGHGPAVTQMTPRPGSVHQGTPRRDVQVAFSGALDPSSLTEDSFQVYYSESATFFDGDDELLSDEDGSIGWDAQTRTATWESASILPLGYYRVVLDGDAGGVQSSSGQLLDGEFLNSYIPGNSTAPTWSWSPSGDGLPGGDYVATFSISVSSLGLEAEPLVISELDGSSTVTLYRSSLEGYDQPLVVSLSSQPNGRISHPGQVTIPANAVSTTFTVSAIDNDLIEGATFAELQASASGFLAGSVEFTILDHEPLMVQAADNSIQENQATELTVSRPGTTGDLLVTIYNDRPDALDVLSEVVIPDGQSSVTVEVSAIDNDLVDGNRTAGIRVEAAGTVADSLQIEILDFEPLFLTIETLELRESADSKLATITRTDPNGDLVVMLDSSKVDEAQVPNSVTIPSGQLSATFEIDPIIDGVGDGDQEVVISAVADGYVDAIETITILDDEALVLVIDQTTLSENGGLTQARVRRFSSMGEIDVSLSGDATGVLNFPGSVSIADGLFESDVFELAAIDNDILDGVRSIVLTATATDYFAGQRTINVTDFEVLGLALTGPALISENGGETSVRVERIDDEGDLLIQLTSLDETELTVPSSILIPDGQLLSDPIVVSAVDDLLLDGTQLVSITASAIGYVENEVVVEVSDEENLEITSSVVEFSEFGGQAEVTVRRLNTNLALPLTVQVAYSDDTELTGPSEVVIPAFQVSLQFIVSAVDDTVIDGDQAVKVTVSAASYIEAELEVSVLDYEALTLTSDVSEMSESNGVAVFTVARPQAEATELVVRLESSDETELLVPSTVTIPENEASVSFEVTSVDDDVRDGDVLVQISAEADPYLDAGAELTVLDHEALGLMIDKLRVAEDESDGFVRATVTRPGGTEGALTVMVTSSPAGLIRTPTAITIPDGMASAGFNVRPIYDDRVTGTQSATIIVEATEFVQQTAVVLIDDVDPLRIDALATSLVEDGESTTVTLTRDVAGEKLVLAISASDTNQLSFPAEVVLPSGELSVSFEVTTIDNQLLDGEREVELMVGEAGGLPSTLSLAIVDQEFLEIALDRDSVGEGDGTVQAEVRRLNVDLGLPIEVILETEQTDLISVPASVTIPSGSAFATIEVTILDDTQVENDANFEILISSSGYQDAMASGTVVDDDLYSWTNRTLRFDVNGDGAVSAIDALLVINELNETGGGALPKPDADPGIYFDVSEDEFLSPIDALMVVNYLNNPGGGEGELGTPNEVDDFWAEYAPYVDLNELRKEQFIQLGRNSRSPGF